MKLSLKINLIFAIIVTSILLVMSVIIYNVSRQDVKVDFKRRLDNRAARTSYLYEVFRYDTTNLLKSLDANVPPQLYHKSIIIFNQNQQVLYEYHDEESLKLDVDSNYVQAAWNQGSVFYSAGDREVSLYRNLEKGNPYVVLVAAENIWGKNYTNNLQRLFLIFVPGALLVTLIAGYIFSRSIIRPIRETIHDARLITSQNLSQRLYVGKNKDELAELNASFNELLNRLEESFAIQRRFISNASHELSTPLTVMSSQIEVALLQDRNPDQYKAVLRSVEEEVRGLQQLNRTLLEIAKAGTHGAISLDKVRIDELLIRAHGEVLKQNPDYRIKLDFADLPEDENECLVFGNATLLNSAFKNIMENGCKYSPDKLVQVQLSFNKQEVEIKFSNKSDTLSEEEINRLFEPFYRSANAEGKQGVGLGLTLTRRIIGLHKGQLLVTSDHESGTVFQIIIPTLKK